MPKRTTATIKTDGEAVELPLSQEGDWMIFKVESIGANVQMKVGSNQRTSWATLSCPEGKIIKLARPMHPGAGPQPDNTITYTELHDMIAEIIRSLEWSLEIQEPTLATVKEQGW